MTEDTKTGAPGELRERITAYLADGGLFNQEMAIHTAVRDLLMDCREVLADHARVVQERDALKRLVAWAVWRFMDTKEPNAAPRHLPLEVAQQMREAAKGVALSADPKGDPR